MQKLTFLINSLSSGGAEKVLSILINELSTRYNVEVILLEKNDFYELSKNVKKTYLTNLTGNENGIKKLLYLPILAWRLKNYIKNNDIKLIQSHIYRANYINILAKILGANHKIQIVNAGRIGRYEELGLEGKINLFLIKYLYSQADLIIWKSKGMQKDSNRLFSFNNKQMVIYNPCNIEEIYYLSQKSIDNFRFKNDKVYLVSVGRLIKLKRNIDLIKALKFLDKNVEVIFLGEGSEKENLIKLTRKLNMEKRVHFLGQVYNPYKYIKKSNLFVHTSESEGFPNVIVEALACGVPVISSDCISGPREILAPNTDIDKNLKKGDDIELAKYGTLFPVGDVNGLAKAINLLISNKKLREQYTRLGAERAKDFLVEKIVAKYEKVLLDENSN